jgi:hypothetical protein
MFTTAPSPTPLFLISDLLQAFIISLKMIGFILSSNLIPEVLKTVFNSRFLIKFCTHFICHTSCTFVQHHITCVDRHSNIRRKLEVMTPSTMCKFSALFLKRIWSIFIRPSQKISHTRLHLYFRIFYLYLVLLGWKNKRFWKKWRHAFLLISVYVQLCFDRHVTKYLKFVYFLLGSRVARSYDYLDHSLQSCIKILDRLVEFSCELYIQTRSENQLTFSPLASESKVNTHAGSQGNKNTWHFTSGPG